MPRLHPFEYSLVDESRTPGKIDEFKLVNLRAICLEYVEEGSVTSWKERWKDFLVLNLLQRNFWEDSTVPADEVVECIFEC